MPIQVVMLIIIVCFILAISGIDHFLKRKHVEMAIRREVSKSLLILGVFVQVLLTIVLAKSSL